MTTQTFTEETKDWLVGKKIIDVKENYILLDNGIRIYLGDLEIENLNG